MKHTALFLGLLLLMSGCADNKQAITATGTSENFTDVDRADLKERDLRCILGFYLKYKDDHDGAIPKDLDALLTVGAPKEQIDYYKKLNYVLVGERKIHNLVVVAQVIQHNPTKIVEIDIHSNVSRLDP